jgi:hypothetical protein
MTVMSKAGLATLVAAALMANSALAKVGADQAAKLGVSGTPLTPMGAERAGNADGSIPAWTGGITQPPAGYKIGMHHPDPFASDKPLMTITAKNYKDYADQLTVGQDGDVREVTRTGRMAVYPTRRTAASNPATDL